MCDPLGHLKHKIRSLIRLSLRKMGLKKNSKTQDIIGCSYEELQVHLQKKVDYWNQLMGPLTNVHLTGKLALDHIKPLSTAKTEEEVKQLNHYTNLQLLWHDINIKKSDNWNAEDEEFWKNNIYLNPDFVNVYVPSNIWNAILDKKQND